MKGTKVERINPQVKEKIAVLAFVDCTTTGRHTSIAGEPGRLTASR